MKIRHKGFVVDDELHNILMNLKVLDRNESATKLVNYYRDVPDEINYEKYNKYITWAKSEFDELVGLIKQHGINYDSIAKHHSSKTRS